jgi:hypothetical protein
MRPSTLTAIAAIGEQLADLAEESKCVADEITVNTPANFRLDEEGRWTAHDGIERRAWPRRSGPFAAADGATTSSGSRVTARPTASRSPQTEELGATAPGA